MADSTTDSTTDSARRTEEVGTERARRNEFVGSTDELKLRAPDGAEIPFSYVLSIRSSSVLCVGIRCSKRNLPAWTNVLRGAPVERARRRLDRRDSSAGENR